MQHKNYAYICVNISTEAPINWNIYDTDQMSCQQNNTSDQLMQVKVFT